MTTDRGDLARRELIQETVQQARNQRAVSTYDSHRVQDAESNQGDPVHQTWQMLQEAPQIVYRPVEELVQQARNKREVFTLDFPTVQARRGDTPAISHDCGSKASKDKGAIAKSSLGCMPNIITIVRVKRFRLVVETPAWWLTMGRVGGCKG